MIDFFGTCSHKAPCYSLMLQPVPQLITSRRVWTGSTATRLVLLTGFEHALRMPGSLTPSCSQSLQLALQQDHKLNSTEALAG